ncbi:Cof-type HAD-IIB family hydrolase [Neobacillus cucumis]|uniref:Cof-type HAD-IIB family hydrolase n=1 Tax=Neobacillus cucumis TaxID=1740721 RepID=UPI0028531640|nr:Cof-type HAD-IIB family hydrolase [Neobacillus cucumis]MDR4949656.1 Cof-type HAD-IIB family hydrolase [Neobacillus cucumis]
MQKIIFMDVDGTLVNDHGEIPESAKLAVRKARENGHLVYLSTGRSKSELFSHVLEVGFDGIIGAAGGYIEVGEAVLFHERMKQEDIELIVEYFNRNEIDFFLEANSGIYASQNCKKHFRSIIKKILSENPEAKAQIEKGIQHFHDFLIEGEDLLSREDINKVSFLGSHLSIETISQEFASKFTIIPSTVPMFGHNSGELMILGIHKATAIEIVINHLNIRKEDTFAYGDGLNDIEMLEFVQHGIAMGNAKEAVKKAADDITDTVEEDGIYNSFKKYGLI